MATIDVILSNIAAAVPELSSTSVTAIYRKIAEAIGITIDNTLQEFSDTENVITEIIASQRYLTSGYYLTKAKAYQDGDSLVQDPVTFDYAYPVIDPTKQIITQAAFIEQIVAGNDTLVLKVARTNPITLLLDALTPTQLTAFMSYFKTFEAPGLPITIVSISANILNFTAQVDYFSTFDFNTMQSDVLAALNAFRDSFAFNGVLYVNDIETYVKNTVPAVRNFSISFPTIDGTPFADKIALLSGYFNYDNTVPTNITYEAV